jgi:hypothetical protein
VEFLLLLILACLVVIIIVLVRVLRSRSAAGPRPATAAAPVDPLADTNLAGDVRTLRPGDMVEYLGTLYFVRGSLRLTQGGYAWSEHFLDDARSMKRWLSVEEDPHLEVVMWLARDIELTPTERVLTVDGVEYRREEHGTATFRSEGTTGLGQTGTMEYVDYEGPDNTYLSFERYGGGEWEAGGGEQVLMTALTVYPSGPGRSGSASET